MKYIDENTVVTEDGYTFYILPCGKVADSASLSDSNMVFDSIEELETAMLD